MCVTEAACVQAQAGATLAFADTLRHPLHAAASLHIEFPMLFEISNLREGRVSHCGVMEFVADEGVVYLPYWARLLCLRQPRHMAHGGLRADDAEPAAAGG
jgi:hypothetical protein